jgi:ATP-dependent Clp protease protease subunit
METEFPSASETKSLPAPPIYAVMAGEINQFTVHRLFHVITTAAQNDGRAVHLLLQSTGGAPQDGVALYNFLKGFPIATTVYNVGTVSSAATTGYLGAPIRIASKYASFMIHRPYASPQFLNPERMQAQLAGLVIDDDRTEAIMRAETKIPAERWETHKSADLWLTAQEAKDFGLVTEIAEFAPPARSLVLNVLPG